MRFMPYCLAFVALTGFAAEACAQPAGSLQAKLTAPAIADFPLLIDLTITPTGQPFSFWSLGEEYPQADLFTGTLTDSKGRARQITFYNGVGVQGSGGFHKVDHPIVCPLATEPLLPGEYSLSISSPEDRGGETVAWPGMKMTEPLKFTVTQDAAAYKIAVEKLHAKATDDSFEKHVEFVFGLDPETPALFKTLLSPDQVTAFSVVGRLQNVRRFPAGCAAILLQAAQLHLKDPLISYNKEHQFADTNMVANYNLLNYLAIIASHVKPEEGLQTVLAIAHGNAGDASLNAIGHLEEFPHSKPVEEILVEFTHDSDPTKVWCAMMALAQYHNPAAADYMLNVLRNGKEKENRGTAAEALAAFPERADVRQAMRDATKDADPRVKAAAEAFVHAAASAPAK